MGRTRLVINPSLVGGLTRESRERMEADALAALKRGDKQEAQRLLDEVASAEAGGPGLKEVPFTAEEEAARDAEEAEAEAALREAEARVVRRAELAAKLRDGAATEAERDEALALALGAA